jgi:hypothetical protein
MKNKSNNQESEKKNYMIYGIVVCVLLLITLFFYGKEKYSVLENEPSYTNQETAKDV